MPIRRGIGDNTYTMPTSSPLSPQGGGPIEWKPLHRAMCTAIKRGVVERGEDITGFGLRADSPNLDSRIRAVVEVAHPIGMSRLLMRDVSRHGFLPGGWTTSWPPVGREYVPEPLAPVPELPLLDVAEPEPERAAPKPN